MLTLSCQEHSLSSAFQDSCGRKGLKGVGIFHKGLLYCKRLGIFHYHPHIMSQMSLCVLHSMFLCLSYVSAGMSRIFCCDLLLVCFLFCPIFPV